MVAVKYHAIIQSNKEIDMDDKGFVDKIQDSFSDLISRGVDFLPKLAAALLLIFVGVMVAKFASKLVGKGIDFIEKSSWFQKSLKKTGLNVVSVSSITSMLARWTILIIFLSAAVDVLELTVLTDTFQSILAFIPNIFAAALIAGLSIFAGNIVYDIVHETAKNAKVGSYKALAMASKVIILVFGIPLAASQLELDLSIITDNLTIVMAGFMLALGLAFGLGGRDTAGKIVDDLYKKMKK